MNVIQSLFKPSLQRRITLAMLTSGLLTLILMGIIGTVYAINTIEHQIGEQLDTIAANTIESIDRVMFDRINDVQTFAEGSDAQTLDPAILTSVMNDYVFTHRPFYELMIVADRNGIIQAVNTLNGDSAIPTLPLLNQSVAEYEWFRVWFDQPLPAGQSYVLELHVSPLAVETTPDAARVIILSYPIRDEKGSIVGIWSTFLDWKSIQTIIDESLARSRANDAQSIEIALIDRNGLVLAANKEEDILQRQIDLKEDIQKSLIQRTFAEDFGRNWYQPDLMVGAAISYGYSKYFGSEWIVLTTQQRAEALEPIEIFLQSILVAAMLVAIGILISGIFIGSTMTRPIVALTQAATQAAEGNLNQYVDVDQKDNDEVVQLAQTFNHMILQLRDSHQTLEDRITQRTSDLQQTLSQLQSTLRERDQLGQQLLESSIPIIPVFTGIAVLPIVGNLDNDRAQQMQTMLLQEIEKEHLHTILLDITAVPVVDTYIAQAFIDAIQAAQLLGCTVYLVGIRPEVAQSIVNLGIAFESIHTFATLQAGLFSALSQYKISKLLQSR